MGAKRRPMWITNIKRRVSLNAFKLKMKEQNFDERTIQKFVTGSPKKFVYKVTVETMENSDGDCFEDIWISDELAKATGDMYEEFEEKCDSLKEQEDVIEDLEHVGSDSDSD